MDISFVPITLKSEILYRGKRINVRVDEVDCKLDFPVKREVVEHPGAVVILPISDDKKIIFVHQYRHALGFTTYELPAGTRELGEDPLSTAKRELSEEVKYSANNWKSLGTIYPLPGLSNELQHLFLATSLYVDYKDSDPGEYIEVAEFTLDQVKEMIISNLITDAKTIAALYKAVLLGLI